MEDNETDFLDRSIAIFRKRWKFFMAIFTPILLLPVLYLTNEKEGKAAYVCILMMINWALELLPIAITSLLPVAFLPFFEIISTDYIARIYLNDTVIIFFVSLSMVVAFEHSDLHRRIALRTLVSTGKRINILMMGFIGTTAFLSFWISNVATTAMMILIAKATIKEFEIFQMREDMGIIETKDNLRPTEENNSEYLNAENSEEFNTLNLNIDYTGSYNTLSPNIGNPEDYYIENNHKTKSIKKQQNWKPNKGNIQNSKIYHPDNLIINPNNHDSENIEIESSKDDDTTYLKVENLDHHSEEIKSESELTRFQSLLGSLSTTPNGRHSTSAEIKNRKRKPTRKSIVSKRSTKERKSTRRSIISKRSTKERKSTRRSIISKKSTKERKSTRKSIVSKKSAKERGSIKARRSVAKIKRKSVISKAETRKSRKSRKVERSSKNRNHRIIRNYERKHAEIGEERNMIRRLKIALFLSIAYAANIGGSMTLTGTITNVVFIDIFKKRYPGSNELTYHAWIFYNIPIVLISLTIAWGYLITIATNNKKFLQTENEEIKRRVKLHYFELGAISFHEVCVCILLAILVLLSVFRQPNFIYGWEQLFNSQIKIHNATPGIAVFALLFIIPARPTEMCRSPPLLDWKTLKYNLPWGIVFFMGGAIAMAEGVEKSGLSAWIAKKLIALKEIAEEGVVIILTFVALLITAGVSNVATAKIMIIVTSELSEVIRINPLYLLIPVMLCCSYSFVSRAGTPTNAIVFEEADMTFKQMAIPGVILSISCYIVHILMISTLGAAMFKLRTFPSWAEKAQNNTIT